MFRSQRSSPQNNFRRVIAAHIPAGEICFDTVSYVPQIDGATRLPPDFLLALLNSKLIDWYFRLGSTNSKVNEYQFINLPCPFFRNTTDESDKALASDAKKLIDAEPSDLPDLLEPAWSKAPFSPVVRDVLGQLAARIETLERGAIPRQDRSHLCDAAQPFQDAIDLILFRVAALSAKDVSGIETRLADML